MTRFGDPETALVPAFLTGSVAGGAHPGDRACLGAGSVAGRARALAGQPQRDGGAVDRVAEAQRGLGLDVGTTPRPVSRGGAAAAAAEHPAEQVAETTPCIAGAAEDVAQVEAAEAALSRPLSRGHPEAAAEHRARLVVLLAPLLVGEHRVRLGDLLEALLSRGVALVRVRMVLAGQLAVRRLDLGRLRGLGDPQGLVVILLEEVLSAHLLISGTGGSSGSRWGLVVFLGIGPLGLVARSEEH